MNIHTHKVQNLLIEFLYFLAVEDRYLRNGKATYAVLSALHAQPTRTGMWNTYRYRYKVPRK